MQMQGEWPCPYIMKTYRGRDLIPNGVVIERGHPNTKCASISK